jgi:A/G-specific adenine glycosylase
LEEKILQTTETFDSGIVSRLLAWYELHARDLPWRHTRNPYFIWLSEVILQQTRVAQGMPYYNAFTQKFPTVDLLAEADEQEVLRVWQGLGYYSRARNLHKTARFVHEQLDGTFPDNYHQLLQLPGIGPYTAAAIASFAFHEKVAVVDGNVFRVLSRLFAIDTDILSLKGKKQFTQIATDLLPARGSHIFNQSMMELGALVCLPRNPQCDICPLRLDCESRKAGIQATFPVRLKKQAPKARYLHYLILEHKGQLHLRKRTGKDIWQGLFDFPALETSEAELGTMAWTKVWDPDWAALDPSAWTFIGRNKHQLTHQTLHACAYLVPLPQRPPTLDFYSPEQIKELPKPVLINKFLEVLNMS